MYLSTIVISEYHQKETIVNILETENFQILPFNVEDAVVVSDLAHRLGQNIRGDGNRAEFKDDIKLMAQAQNNKIDYLITEDETTLAKYSRKLFNANIFSSKTIVVKEGFDSSIFNNGQTTFLEQSSD